MSSFQRLYGGECTLAVNELLKYERMRKAIKIGADSGLSLASAIALSNLDLITRLITQMGVKIDANMGVNPERYRSVLMLAIEFGSDKSCEKLIKLGAKHLINYPDEVTGRTPFMLAVAKSNKKIVEILLKQGADLTIKDNLGFTALDLAVDPVIKNLFTKKSVEEVKQAPVRKEFLHLIKRIRINTALSKRLP